MLGGPPYIYVLYLMPSVLCCDRFQGDQHSKLTENFRFMDVGNAFMPSTVSVCVPACARMAVRVHVCMFSYACGLRCYSTVSISYPSLVICLKHSPLLHHLVTHHHKFPRHVQQMAW